MKKIFILFQLTLISSISLAQTHTDSAIAIEARSYADHIVLRYFATTSVLFNRANKTGYIIEKASFKDGISLENLTYIPIKGSPVKQYRSSCKIS